MFIFFIVFSMGCEKTSKQITKPTVTTVEVTNISGISATSGGVVTNDGGSQISARGIVWNTSENPTIEFYQGITLNGTGLGEYVSNLFPLSIETTYYIRAYATNSIGTAYGQELNFTTQSSSIVYGNGVTDIDGNFYPSIIIGSQEWLTKNLRVTHYNDNSSILGDLSNNDWKNTTDGAFAIYPYINISGLNSEEEVLNSYGALYNCYAVEDSRGLCPIGWHVPTDEEWDLLSEFLLNNNTSITTNTLADKLKSCRQVGSPLGDLCSTNDHPRWNAHETNFGSNNFGFDALPGGYRNFSGSYSFVGLRGQWWSTTEFDEFCINRVISFNQGRITKDNTQKQFGLSIRCVKN